MQRLRPSSIIDVAMLPAALCVVAALQAREEQAQTTSPVPTLPPAAQPTAPPEVQGDGPARRAAPPRVMDPAHPFQGKSAGSATRDKKPGRGRPAAVSQSGDDGYSTPNWHDVGDPSPRLLGE